jgi:HlyD family secretion protein
MPLNRFFTLLVVASTFALSCSADQSQPSGRQVVIPSVEVVEARYGTLPLEERLSGTVVADNQVDVYPEMSGVIEQVLVKNGDVVKRGQILVKIRDTEMRERLKQAQAGLQIAQARSEQAQAALSQIQAQYERAKTLSDRNLSSQAEMDNITAQLSSARANASLATAQVVQANSELEQANVNLARTVVRSPVDGLAGQRQVEPGQLVSGNTRIVTVGNPSSVRVTMVLTERMMSYIKEGMNAQITSPSYPDSSLMAEIARISPFLDPLSRTTTAEIDISNKSRFLIPGMFVAVDVFYGESENATLIPNSAVYQHPRTGIIGVYVAKSLGTEVKPQESVDASSPPPLSEPTPVEFVEIKVLAKGRNVSGVSGINSGSWIVTVGQNLLAGGAKEARVRTTGWDRILGLQALNEEDLLKSVINGSAAKSAAPSM